MISRTLLMLIFFAATYGGLGLWGFYEHEHLVAEEGLVASSKAEIGKWQEATMQQNVAIKQLQDEENQVRARAAQASREARASEARAAAEHERLKALIDKPSAQKSCDAAWDEIEQGG